jgi:hypothetical protein
MKTLSPLPEYRSEGSYPSLHETSRRGFLRSALAGSSLAAAALLLPGRGARAAAPRRRPPEKQVELRLSRGYTFRHGNQRLERLVVQSPDEALITLLGTRTESPAIEKVVVQILDAHSCVDLGDGKRLAALQQRLAKAIATHASTRTRRKVVPPVVTLFIGLPYATCLGTCPAPVPYCRPPTP